MAKQTLIIDDLTGETGARTRALRFDGVDYEIDLTDASYAELRRLLKPYLKVARTPGRRAAAPARRGPSAKAKANSSTSDAATIRAWARANGVPVTERGRVHPDVRAAWVAAGSPR